MTLSHAVAMTGIYVVTALIHEVSHLGVAFIFDKTAMIVLTFKPFRIRTIAHLTNRQWIHASTAGVLAGLVCILYSTLIHTIFGWLLLPYLLMCQGDLKRILKLDWNLYRRGDK